MQRILTLSRPKQFLIGLGLFFIALTGSSAVGSSQAFACSPINTGSESDYQGLIANMQVHHYNGTYSWVNDTSSWISVNSYHAASNPPLWTAGSSDARIAQVNSSGTLVQETAGEYFQQIATNCTANGVGAVLLYVNGNTTSNNVNSSGNIYAGSGVGWVLDCGVLNGDPQNFVIAGYGVPTGALPGGTWTVVIDGVATNTTGAHNGFTNYATLTYQEPTPNWTIGGTIKSVQGNTSIPVSGMKVYDCNGNYATTDSSGNYSFTEVNNAGYCLRPPQAGSCTNSGGTMGAPPTNAYQLSPCSYELQKATGNDTTKNFTYYQSSLGYLQSASCSLVNGWAYTDPAARAYVELWTSTDGVTFSPAANSIMQTNVTRTDVDNYLSTIYPSPVPYYYANPPKFGYSFGYPQDQSIIDSKTPIYVEVEASSSSNMSNGWFLPNSSNPATTILQVTNSPCDHAPNTPTLAQSCSGNNTGRPLVNVSNANDSDWPTGTPNPPPGQVQYTILVDGNTVATYAPGYNLTTIDMTPYDQLSQHNVQVNVNDINSAGYVVQGNPSWNTSVTLTYMPCYIPSCSAAPAFFSVPSDFVTGSPGTVFTSAQMGFAPQNIGGTGPTISTNVPPAGIILGKNDTMSSYLKDTAGITYSGAPSSVNGQSIYTINSGYLRSSLPQGTYTLYATFSDPSATPPVSNTCTSQTVTHSGYGPFFTVTGGDVQAGSTFGFGTTNCTDAKQDGIVSWNQENVNYSAGAGSQMAAFALGSIYDFATANLSDSASSTTATDPAPPAGLSFANTGFTGGGPYFGGNFGYAPCAPNQDPSTVKGTYYTSDQRVPTTTYTAGNTVIEGISGNAYISGNQTYANSGYSVSSTGVPSIPTFELIVKGNIYIDTSVTELDGIYIAEPVSASSTTTGIIYDCATGDNAPYNSQNTNYFTGCQNVLNVNGSLIGSQLKLMRTNGNLYNTTGNCTKAGNCTSTPAEIVNYNALEWLAPVGANNSNTQAEVNLPPVL